MKFKQKMFTLYCVPMLVYGILLLFIGLIQFENGMYKETRNSLKSSALAAMSLYNSQGYGDYALKSDGNVWRGMNFNISQETGIVDELKEQTGVDITFFFGDTAVMTSVMNESNDRWYGMQAGANITNYTLKQGAQLWYRNIEIDGKMCHAYLIPIVQPGDGTVTGAMMASLPTTEFDGIIKRYVMISVVIALVVLLVVGGFIYWYIGGLTKVLHNVREVLSKVSNGQFEDERLVEIRRRDEFGDLAACTEKLRLKIYDILDDIRHGTTKLTEAVERLNRTSESTRQAAVSMSGSVAQIEDTANRQQSGTTQAAQDVEATKQAIDEMLVQIEGINQISRDMEDMSKESAGILRELEESSKKAQDTVLAVRNQTDTTNESVKQIKSVTEYITNIAEETNLLALNASIEAARAGDAGRGFAVVAQQIQKLAEESNHSAAQIGDNIKDLVEKTEENLAAMNLIGEVLKSQEDKVNRTKDIFGELNHSINMVTDKENNMQQNIQSMNRAKDNMSHVIEELAQSSMTNVSTAQVTAEAADQMQEEVKGITELSSDLTGLAEDLNQNLQSFLS
ncbi:MAG: methyl-accepting chemotaxis protein [Lachnospiraceae bacterium]|nr:methyl-accepting chemotaxis protein [Lachnospiraceae bacterium]